METNKTLLDAVREHGIIEVKEILDASNGELSRNTLDNYRKNKPNLFKMICIAVKSEKQNEAA